MQQNISEQNYYQEDEIDLKQLLERWQIENGLFLALLDLSLYWLLLTLYQFHQLTKPVFLFYHRANLQYYS